MSQYLTAAEVLPFLHGCCGTYTLEGYTGFSRFTAEELTYYSDHGDSSDAYWNRMEPHCAGLAAVSRSHGISVIPGKPLIPELKYLFFEDYTHFNEAGSAIFAGNLLYAVQQLRRGNHSV